MGGLSIAADTQAPIFCRVVKRTQTVSGGIRIKQLRSLLKNGSVRGNYLIRGQRLQKSVNINQRVRRGN